MLRFKQHITERASQLRSVDLMDADSYDEAYEKLMQLKPTKLGEGMFSAVFGGEGKLVVKLTDSGTDGTYWYLQEAKKRWMQNPHFPRVAFIKPFELSYGYVAVMEQLDFSIGSIERVFGISFNNIKHIIFDYMDYKVSKDKEKIYFPLIHKFPKLVEVFETILDLDEKYISKFDLHSGNIAVRKNTPVIVDPLSATISSYNTK